MDRGTGRIWQQLAARSLGDGLTDGELVRRMSTDHREAAFAALVHRHGPLVLGVCRRVLGELHSAEDAFQATFLVLLQKAETVRDLQSLAAWLHGVAVRVSRKALVRSARSRARERKVGTMETYLPESDDLGDARRLLDDEIARLRPEYRDVLALCYFEGKTNLEAARILGCPEGTVSGRLSRARDLLRDRLSRRGVTCSVAGVTTLLTSLPSTAVPPSLASTTVALASGLAAPPAVAALATAAMGTRGLAWTVALSFFIVMGAGIATVAMVASPNRSSATKPNSESPAESIRFTHSTTTVALAVRGDRIATAGADATVGIWTPEGKLVRRLSGHRDGAMAVAFAPDSRRLASAGHDGIVRLWNANGELLREFAGHGEAASAVAFAPDGRTLAAAGWDGTVRVWNAETGKPTVSIDAHRGKAWGVAFSPDGRRLASAGDKQLRIWNAADGAPVRRIDGLKGGPYAVAFVDSRTVAASCDNTVALFSIDTGREVARVGGPQLAVTAFAVSPDGRSIAWGGGDRAVHLWEIATRQERQSFTTSQDVTCLGSDGNRLIVGGSGGEVEVRQLARLATALTEKQLPAAWNDLTGSDAAKAYRAVRSLAAVPELSVPFLAEKLPHSPGFEAHLQRLIADLDAPAFADRDAVTRELRILGSVAAPALQKAIAETPSVELRERSEQLLKRMPSDDALSVPLGRAFEVLELAGTERVRELFVDLARQKPESELSRQAAAALERIRQRMAQ